MARFLALDWDRHEARYVLATTSGRKVTVLSAQSVPLADGDEAPSPGPGALLRKALPRGKAARTQVLVGLGRGSIELMHFTVPPATDKELPELVLNQAIRESQSVTEDTLLDFVAVNDTAGEPRRITAATIEPAELERVKGICKDAGLKPQRMLLRPFASASLFARTETAAEAPCLLVNRVGDEVDLSIMAGGRAVFSRTARLHDASDEEKTTRQIVVEIGRTLAVASQDQLVGGTIETVYVFGGPEEYAELIELIGAEIPLVAKIIDPFKAVGIRQSQYPDDAGKYASLLGMLVDEAHSAGHAIDFLNPKKKPKPPNRAWIAAAAAGVLAVFGLWTWYQAHGEFVELDAQIANLNSDYSKVHRQIQEAALPHVGQLKGRRVDYARTLGAVRGQIEAWDTADVNWLDELRDLSLRLPSSRDILLLRMNMAPSRAGGGIVSFNGLVRDPLVVVRMETDIRDYFHGISSRHQQQRSQSGDYTWSFETSIVASRRPKEYYQTSDQLTGADTQTAPLDSLTTPPTEQPVQQAKQP
jgi:hypothetical protein